VPGTDQAQEEEKKKPLVYRAGNLPPQLPSWFAQYDTDKDGQVGLYEWKAAGQPIARFVEMDQNGDGFLTVEEVLRFDVAEKKKAGNTTQTVAAQQGGSPNGSWGRGSRSSRR